MPNGCHFSEMKSVVMARMLRETHSCTGNPEEVPGWHQEPRTGMRTDTVLVFICKKPEGSCSVPRTSWKADSQAML